MKNVLVVGGAGFIGSSLCKRLIKKCDLVICLDNLMRGKEENVSSIISKENFRFIKGDANDIQLLKKVIIDNKINYIFHLAANSDIQASANNPQIEFECTAKTTWSILTAMKDTGVKNLFFASTSAVYGKEVNGKAFEESDLLNPISYYGSAKMASEAFIKAFSYMNNFNSLIFRFPNVIGPHLTHGVIFDFINRLKDNPNELHVLGNGTQRKPYMYVDDLIDAIDKLCWDNKGVDNYNVGVDSSTSVRDIAMDVIIEMGIKECEISYGNENIGWKGDVPHFAYSLKKIHSTGWKASKTSDEAVLLTIQEALKKW